MTGKVPDWAPVLEGAEAERAVELAHLVASELRSGDGDAALRAGGMSLAGGAPGGALLFAAIGDDEHALDLVDHVISVVADAPFRPSLYSGQIGAGFAFQLLEGSLLEPDDDENDIDALATKVLSVSPWPGPFDLIQGLVGIGVYGLARLPRATGRAIVDATIDRLAEIATAGEPGTVWFTRLGMLPSTADRAERYPEGYFDIGLAHGNAGVIAFLAAAVVAGFEKARTVLESAVLWLLAQRLDESELGCYPLLFGPGEHRSGGRIAWCYGDTSVAVALLAAARALASEDLAQESQRVALLAATRPETAAGVADTPLCHGTAGLGHMFARLAQSLGHEPLLDAARTWIRRSIDAHQPDVPFGGFLSYRPPRADDPGGYVPSAGLLEGSAGVALALLAAAEPKEPTWDAMLLLRPVEAWSV